MKATLPSSLPMVALLANTGSTAFHTRATYGVGATPPEGGSDGPFRRWIDAADPGVLRAVHVSLRRVRRGRRRPLGRARGRSVAPDRSNPLHHGSRGDRARVST